MNLLRSTKPSCSDEEYHHGGEVLPTHEVTNAPSFLDFSVNTNPLGIPDGVKTAIQASLPELERYPDQNCARLREKIAKRFFATHRMTEQHIVCGNGASELISLVVAAIQPKNALLIAPTFSGYERALRANHAKIRHHFLKPENDFELDETIFDEMMQNPVPDMIFLCSPNNPTGRLIEKNLLEKIASVCDEEGIFLVVDECFIDFTERADETMTRFVAGNPHLIVLNAFTKIYALAGLRLGWLATSNGAILARMKILRPEWNVSGLAQIAGEAALDEYIGFTEETRKVVKTEREFLSQELKALGFEVFPSDANFILFEVKNNIKMSEKLDDFLLKHGISLRNCGNFCGLNENYYRTAVRTHEENARLIEILVEFLKK